MSDTPGFSQAYQQASEAFGRFVPGFEFLQGLVRNAGKAMPTMGQWVAPTLDPAEIERRIEELKTVQFWLEQNARLIGATVQALEVQRMTLGTLKGMNVSMGDLSEALKMKVPDIFTSAPAPAPAPARASAAPAQSEDAPSAESAAAAATAAGVDAMQWWGALTQQFAELASQAMQATSEAARQASQATSDAANQAVQAASDAAAAAAEVARPMTEAVREATEAAAAQIAPRKAPRAKSAETGTDKAAAKAPAPAKGAAKTAAGRAAAKKSAAKAPRSTASAGGQSDDKAPPRKRAG